MCQLWQALPLEGSRPCLTVKHFKRTSTHAPHRDSSLTQCATELSMAGPAAPPPGMQHWSGCPHLKLALLSLQLTHVPACPLHLSCRAAPNSIRDPAQTHRPHTIRNTCSPTPPHVYCVFCTPTQRHAVDTASRGQLVVITEVVKVSALKSQTASTAYE